MSGFVPVSETELPEHNVVSRRYVHRATGLDFVHLACDDRENMFAFVFRTPALDDRGTSHILEHSVLCGSERFPLKDPFRILLSGSMQTYLNAWTFPDKTVYPASSTLEKDLFNLMRVYGDAVFRPRLPREVFEQEGFHYELRSDTLGVSGVVYNEMQGVHANPDSLVSRWAHSTLFPDNTYRFESGGEPRAIVDLTYEDLMAYHRRFYHPSNTRVMVYGNIPTERYLEFLENEFLRDVDKLEVDSTVSTVASWTEPTLVERTYPLGKGEQTGERSYVLMNWLVGDAVDPFDLVVAEVLEELLLGHSGAPLRRALIASGLGQDLAPAAGTDTELRQISFSCGLRGTEPDRRAQIEEVVLGELRALADGIDPDTLQAAIRRVEFHNREIRRSGGPHSLELLRKALRGWLHGAAPESALQFQRWMDHIKARSGEGLFEKIIRERLLENPHRSTLVVRPETGGQERLRQEWETLLRERFSTLSAQGREEIQRREEALTAYQERPERPEDVEKLPRLEIADLPREVEPIPRAEGSLRESQLLSHEAFSAGVSYIDLAYPVDHLSDQTLLPLLASMLGEIGLPGRSYDQVARELALKTGGFRVGVESTQDVSGRLRSILTVRFKALSRVLHEAAELVGQLLRESDFGDLARLKQIVHERRNRLRASIIPAGSRYAALRASARLRPSAAITEKWGGASALMHLSTLEADAALSERLATLRDRALIGKPLVSILSEDPARDADVLETFWNAYMGHGRDDGASTVPEVPGGGAESLIIPAPVGFVAQALPGAPYDSPESVGETVLAHMLSTGFLWERIRARGGAYGASAHADGLDRLFVFSTYRDPNLGTTIDAFRESLEGVAAGRFEDADLRGAVVGTVGRDSRPLAPGQKAAVSLRRHLLGIDDAMRQRRREMVLAMDREGLRRTASRLVAGLDQSAIVALCGEGIVETAPESLGELARNRTLLPI